MTLDFIAIFSLGFCFGFVCGSSFLFFCNKKRYDESELSYNLTVIKEDVFNLSAKLDQLSNTYKKV